MSQSVFFCMILYWWVPLWVSQSSSVWYCMGEFSCESVSLLLWYSMGEFCRWSVGLLLYDTVWVSSAVSQPVYCMILYGWVPLWVSQSSSVWYCMGEFNCESVSLLLYDTVWVSSAVSHSVCFCMNSSVWYCMGEFCMILYRWVLLYDTVWVSSAVSQSVFCMILYGWGMAECCCDFKMFFPTLLYCFKQIDQFKFIRSFDFAGTIWSQ